MTAILNVVLSQCDCCTESESADRLQDETSGSTGQEEHRVK